MLYPLDVEVQVLAPSNKAVKTTIRRSLWLPFLFRQAMFQTLANFSVIIDFIGVDRHLQRQERRRRHSGNAQTAT